jgi:DNA-directed RNA polymerase specialized sigma24 family protein
VEKPLLSLEIREAQATACLEVAATYQAELLKYARKLAGSDEGGMELYQQTCLNCHDAIQHRGFVGTEYRFYLVKAITRLHQRTDQMERLRQGLEGLEEAPTGGPACDTRGELVDQMLADVATHFPAERIPLRMHLDGMSYQQIADHTGGHDQSWIRRRVEKVKTYLRTAYGHVLANLEAE